MSDSRGTVSAQWADQQVSPRPDLPILISKLMRLRRVIPQRRGEDGAACLYLTGLAYSQDVVVSVDTREDAGLASTPASTSSATGTTLDRAQAQHDKGDHEQGRATFSIEPHISGQAVMRKVDWHVLPFLCGLSLMCAIDRGTAFPIPSALL